MEKLNDIENINKFGKVIIANYKPVFKSIFTLMILTIIEILIMTTFFERTVSMLIGILAFATITLYFKLNKEYIIIKFKNEYFAVIKDSIEIIELGNINENLLKSKFNDLFSSAVINYFIFSYIAYIVITFIIKSIS